MNWGYINELPTWNKPMGAHWGYTTWTAYWNYTNGLGLFEWTGAIPMDWSYTRDCLLGLWQWTGLTQWTGNGMIPMDADWAIAMDCLLRPTWDWCYKNGLLTVYIQMDCLLKLSLPLQDATHVDSSVSRTIMKCNWKQLDTATFKQDLLASDIVMLLLWSLYTNAGWQTRSITTKNRACTFHSAMVQLSLLSG